MPQSRSPGPQSPSSITAAAASIINAAQARAAVNNDANINPILGNVGVGVGTEIPGFGRLDSAQILALLRHIPDVLNNKYPMGDGSLKDGVELQQHLEAAGVGPNGQPLMQDPNEPPYPDDPNDPEYQLDQSGMPESPQSAGRARRRMFSKQENEDWMRMRKENHKEVERRRRGNINEGISQLAAIIPSESGESKAQAKGAILSRAAQYIQHLKDNEARNIEKWTLEKLLMDQAMGDLQAQLDEAKRVIEDEHAARQGAENEISRLQSELASIRSRESDGEVGSGRKRSRVE